MSTLALNAVRNFLDKDSVGYQTFPDEQIIRLPYRGQHASYDVLVLAKEKILGVEISTPIKIPEGCHSDVAIGVCEANDGLSIGRFDLDFDNGCLRFTASSLHVGQPEEQVIGALLAMSMNVLDEMYPAFLSIIYSNETPREAIGRIKNEMKSDE